MLKFVSIGDGPVTPAHSASPSLRLLVMMRVNEK